VNISSVCIVGGSGFVGRSVADHLCARGLRVRVLTRSRPRAMRIAVLPTAEIEVVNPHDATALTRAFENMDAVVNLVGILNEGGGRTFRGAHVELPRRVVQACHAAGVQHLLHMSALGASPNGPSMYQRTKAEGEGAIRATAGILPVTFFRPSVIFGEGDRFLNLFATLVRLMPVIGLARADARIQPIWIEDVARCFADALGNPRCFGKTFELAGPKVYTLGELVRFVADTLGRRRAIVGLPAPLGYLQALTLEMLPGKLMTRDSLRSLSVDNVCAKPFPEEFAFRPAPLESVVPEYLAGSTARSRYGRYRHYAGR
jgi:NADH dehydrogenase